MNTQQRTNELDLEIGNDAVVRTLNLMFIILVAILALTLVAYAETAGKEKLGSVPTSRAVELAAVDVTKVEPRDISNDVRIAGSLTPIRRAAVTSRVAATVAELPVDVGVVVRTGDLLVRFNADALKSTLTAKQAAVDAMTAQLRLAESVLKRNTDLGSRGVASEATRLESEAQVLNLQAQLRSRQAEVADAERSLGDAEVLATFDGIVATRPVEQGQTVPVNTELMTIVDPSRMEVDAGVPTSRIPRVRVGQPVKLTVEGFAGRAFTGEVVRIAPTAVTGSRAVRVFLAIANDDRVLKGGMFTTGVLKVDDRQSVIALPTAAVRHDEGGSYVLKIVNGILRRQKITLGQSWVDQDLVEVTGPVSGDLVVSAPLPQLLPDTTVTIEGH